MHTIGKGGEDTNLFVAMINGASTFLGNKFFQVGEFGLPGRIDCFGVMKQVCQPLSVLFKFLLPANKIQVLNQHFDLVADKKIFKLRVVCFNIFN